MRVKESFKNELMNLYKRRRRLKIKFREERIEKLDVKLLNFKN